MTQTRDDTNPGLSGSPGAMVPRVRMDVPLISRASMASMYVPVLSGRKLGPCICADTWIEPRSPEYARIFGVCLYPLIGLYPLYVLVSFDWILSPLCA